MKKAPATFGERATAIMETSVIDRPMHYKDIARGAEMNPKRVKNIMTGKVKADTDEALSIAKYLDVPVGYLITGDVTEDEADKKLVAPVTADTVTE